MSPSRHTCHVNANTSCDVLGLVSFVSLRINISRHAYTYMADDVIRTRCGYGNIILINTPHIARTFLPPFAPGVRPTWSRSTVTIHYS